MLVMVQLTNSAYILFTYELHRKRNPLRALRALYSLMFLKKRENVKTATKNNNINERIGKEREKKEK